MHGQQNELNKHNPHSSLKYTCTPKQLFVLAYTINFERFNILDVLNKKQMFRRSLALVAAELSPAAFCNFCSSCTSERSGVLRAHDVNNSRSRMCSSVLFYDDTAVIEIIHVSAGFGNLWLAIHIWFF